MQTHTISIHKAAEDIASGVLTSTALVAACLAAIATRDKQIHALLFHLDKEAEEEARICDAEIKAGRVRGSLHGIPLVIKDNIDVRGMPTTVASPLFAHAAPAPADAPVVARLRSAGAIILGKSNMDELAAHVSGNTSCFGPVYNPWHLEKGLSPGGSSGGTAAAVAAGFCLGGLGTDTGGSIRVPAGWCGLCGIRPTWGYTPMDGVYPRAKSLDVAGPIGRSIRDVALLLQAIAEEPLANALRTLSPVDFSRLRLGILPCLFRSLSPEAGAVYNRVISRFENMGADCVPVELPLLEDASTEETVNTIRSFEFARDIAADMEHNAKAAQVHPIPLADYRKGQTVSVAAYEEALRRKEALGVQADGALRHARLQGFLLPTALFTAPPSAASTETFAAARRLMNLFSLTDVPTVVFRGGLAQNGLPVGMQLVGPCLSEPLLLGIAGAYEDANGGDQSPWAP